MQTQQLVFNSPESVRDWRPIDDRVMGGLSTSRLRFEPAAGHAVFDGVVSLLQGGGFASVRASPLALGQADTQGYALSVLGDGKRYKLNLRTDRTFDGINYQADFQPPAGVWTEVRLALSAFSTSFRGRPAPDAPALDPSHVRQVGLMIADGQAGPFSLAVRQIAWY